MDSSVRINSTFEFDTGVYLGLVNNKYTKDGIEMTVDDLELHEVLADHYKVPLISIVIYNSDQYLNTLLEGKISVQQWNKVTGEITDFELNVP